MANVLLLTREKLYAIVDGLMTDHRVIAPVHRAGELRFDAVTSADEVVLDYRNTTKSPKGAFFPQTETILRYRRTLDRYDDIVEIPLDETPTVLLGVRPCDARSFILLDRVFCQGQFCDPYYRARRQNTVVVTLACDYPRPSCFCHALGSGPYDRQGADVLLRPTNDQPGGAGGYLAEALSERGAALVAHWLLPEANAQQLAEAERIEAAAQARMSPMESVVGIEGALGVLFDSPVWQEIAAKCIACGTCTYICPECHCFNIEDRRLAEGGERVRSWDSCMYTTFTQHASGHNPRPDQAARWRQRTNHKFAYLPRNVDMYGCVGCGRCVLACPVRLDIREVLRTVRREYDQVRSAAQEQK
jgi:ferredoxin